ncbi:hypothetical protein [Sphingopyxis sp.]|uniref:hypothetical protein n=1 Tax=Sphingopyxis sp. TaxID=1908224 RepID=UPI001D7275BB|nr:hypothetical protein [Sphingopyxis sp.]MBW8295689.1 hypothetical protein [Sphingopyxis sp.]
MNQHDIADEIELKFDLFPVDAERITTSRLLDESAKVARQVSSYFGYIEKSFARTGISLRCNRPGDT